jgi:hypothetical protein
VGKYLAELMQMSPERATGLGEHRYDHLLNDYNLRGVKKSRDFNESYLKSIESDSVRPLEQGQ